MLSTSLVIGAIVMELFTSQGCSSCPPADRLLSKIGHERIDGATVIPLAFHVDYWNSLGWTDPFSSAKWSQRQNAYASAMQSPQVYTPQLILNGTTQMVGSDERRVRTEIARLQREAPRAQVAIKRAADHVDVDASLLSSAGASDVFLVSFENGATTSVARGENAGRTLTNDYIVRAIIPAFSLKPGEKMTRAVQAPAGNLAAIVQDRKTLQIYAAAATQ